LVPPLLDVPVEFVEAVRIALAVLLGNAVLIGLADIPRAVLAEENAGYRRVGLSALIVLLTGLFTVIAVRAELGIAGVALAATAGTLLNSALFISVAKHHVHWFGIRRPSRETVRWIGGKSVGFFFWKWINQFLTAGDVLLVGILGSPAMVTVYSLTKYAPDAVIRLTGFVVNGSAASFGRLLSDERYAKLRRARAELMTATWLITTVSGVTVLLWSPSFLVLWVGPGYDQGSTTTLMITILAAQLMFVRNDASLIDLTLKLRSKVLLGVATIAVTVILLVAFVRSDFQITTLCLALATGRIPMSIGYPCIVGRVIGIAPSQQVFPCIRVLLTTTLLFGVAVMLRDSLEALTWLSLSLSVGITVIATISIAMLLGMNSTQQSRIWKRIVGLT